MSSPAKNGNPAYFVVRYDDYGAAYSSACSARLEVEEMLQREMAARGMPWLCSITPRQSVNPFDCTEKRTVHLSEDKERMRLLATAVKDGSFLPAVHGLTHRSWKKLPIYGTEFAGLPQEEQHKILRTARREVEALVGREVRTFVPPWNSFDQGTLNSAAATGYELFSGGITSSFETEPPVQMVPATLDLRDLKRIAEREQPFPAGSVAVLLFHAFDFVNVDSELGHMRLEEFGPLLDRTKRALGVRVIPMTDVPRVTEGHLNTRARHALALHRRYFRLTAIPRAGGLMRDWIMRQSFSRTLLPMNKDRAVNRCLTVFVGTWFAVVAGLACVPALLVASLISWRPGRSVGLMAFVMVGMLLMVRSTRFACLKRYGARWGTRSIGWRTWTGFTAGLVVAMSSLVTLVVPWMQARL